jgi:biopolymer transport protein TolR
MSMVNQGRRFRRRRMSEINVVPYIDVMLVLLVIFMVTAPLLAEGVKVKLPQASARPIDSRDEVPVVVTVDRDGQMYLNISDKPNAAVAPDDLVARVAAVKRRNPDADILVRGDSDANYGNVVGAMVLLQQAGVENVGLVTRSPQQARKRK